MAEFNIDGRMKVKKLKQQFKDEFGATLRVYENDKQKKFADDDATLASIRGEGAKGGELACRGNLRVGSFEEKMKEIFGISVQVATPDNDKLAKNDITLSAAGK